VPAIPEPLHRGALAVMSASEFAALLRAHLVPRSPTGEERRRWERLWQLLDADDELADRAFDVLERDLDLARDALATGGLEAHTVKRIEKFQRFCNEAWKRLEASEADVLGRRGQRFPRKIRRTIADLVRAIDQHREAVTGSEQPRPADEELWQVLGRVGLDPKDLRQ
jgi:hypothetical protein